MCLAQGPQRSDAGEARTCDPSVSSQVLSGHLKVDKTMVLMKNGSIMKVESIAECSLWSILQCF